MQKCDGEREDLHIVVVDDEPQFRETLRDCLEPEGYRISEAEGRRDLFDIIEREMVHLVTLDLKLRGTDGLSIAREIRARSDIPIIMLTARDDPLDRILGLELGADDYITKPFHVREVLARVRSVLRRRGPDVTTWGQLAGKRENWSFDGWVLDGVRRRLTSPEGECCTLTTSEFNLLKALLRHPNIPLERNRIMDLVKGPDWMANDRAVDNQIGRLRRKMASLDGQGDDVIQSVRGVGYMLAADVTLKYDN